MSYFTKKNIFLWAFILLLVFNISAIIAFFSHIREADKSETEFRNQQQPNPRCFIQEELDLSDEQLSKFDDMRNSHIRSSRKFRGIVHKKHNVLYDEITKENPDSSVVNATLNEIGKLHIQLYQNNINHYKELKTICREEQIEKLNEFYKNMMFQNKRHHHRPNNIHKRLNKKYRKN